MKALLLSFSFLLVATLGYSQIVITEIMYNPPEGGQDSLEFVEIFNTGNDMVDISGYHFLEGIVDTVANGVMLPAGAYYVFGGNAQAMSTVFGITVDEWSDGALKNGGEIVLFADASGATVDMVEFGDDEPWPTSDDGTDGEGASIELCDVNSDNNNGTSWRAADNDTGIMLNDRVLKATPGTANTVVCEVTVDHMVEVTSNQFTPADITINVGETVGWTNLGGNHNINGTQATYPNNPESFGNGAASSAAWTYEFTFGNIGVYDYQCDPHVGFGMVGTVTVIDPDMPEFPEYDIATVTTTDADGVADSLFVNCTISGTVHSINYRPSGLTFALIDASNNGINVFADSDNLGYTVAQGDFLKVQGEIGQFNGLTQITPVGIEVTGTEDLFIPTSITELNEDTESQLVILTGSFTEGTGDGEWLGDGSSYNVDVNVDGGGTITMRIDSDIDAASMSAGNCGSYRIIGIGGQFDNESPFDSGYQLLPRSIDDIECLSSTNDLAEDGDIMIAPNPATDFITVITDVEIERVVIFDVLGRIVNQASYTNQIDISTLDSGIYQITFINGERTHTISMIKK